LFCASEVTPFAKTGGLADVAASLPVALGKLGVETAVMMPRYRKLGPAPRKLSKRVTVYFIESDAYFNRSSLYGNEGGDYPDNLQRFSFFSHEVLNLAKKIKFRPDIVHVNDWQTAVVPVLLKTKLASDPFFKKSKTLLTIHNLQYQGHFPERLFPELGFDRTLFSINGFEYYGKVNLLKAGILYADAVSTVSPTYAGEIQTAEYGYGLEGVVRQRRDRLRGILNGIDVQMWNPAKDRSLQKNYSSKEPAGKQACKAALQKRCGLEVRADIPLFGMVTRLAGQKGIDILAQAASGFLSKKVQFVLLGDGDRIYERTFRNIGRRYSKNAAVYLGFNAAEAHGIYAGADFFLMPSLFEPCGLGQMISFRYGALPVARRTGGLSDTVVDIDLNPRKANGISFDEPTPEAFLTAVQRAIKLFGERKRFKALQRRVMALDFSWKRSAREYLKFYRQILGGEKPLKDEPA
jgi:starch synthase